MYVSMYPLEYAYSPYSQGPPLGIDDTWPLSGSV